MLFLYFCFPQKTVTSLVTMQQITSDIRIPITEKLRTLFPSDDLIFGGDNCNTPTPCASNDAGLNNWSQLNQFANVAEFIVTTDFIDQYLSKPEYKLQPSGSLITELTNWVDDEERELMVERYFRQMRKTAPPTLHTHLLSPITSNEGSEKGDYIETPMAIEKTNSDKQDTPASASTSGHPSACKPCAFFWGKGCLNAEKCQFCHEAHPAKKKKPMRLQKNLMIIARPGVKLRFLRCSYEQALSYSALN